MKCESQPAPNEAAENRDRGARNRFTRQSKRVPHRNALSMKVTPAVVRLTKLSAPTHRPEFLLRNPRPLARLLAKADFEECFDFSECADLQGFSCGQIGIFHRLILVARRLKVLN